MKPSTIAMKRTGFSRAKRVEVLQVAKVTRRIKSKQRAVTAAEKTLWDRMASVVGCIACRIDGRFNTYVSIHHIEGRTKPGCHQLVLSLCAGHHQDGTGEDKSLVAVHPYKARFEALYGPQNALLAKCMELIKSSEVPNE